MNGNWEHLGQAVRERRNDLRLTQVQVSAAGGPSTATQNSIEQGKAARYRGSSLRDLERVLGWAKGSIDALLAGGEPTSRGEEPLGVVGAALAAAPNGLGEIDRYLDNILRDAERAQAALRALTG